ITVQRVARTAWPVGLLLLFVVVARGGGRSETIAQPADRCSHQQTNIPALEACLALDSDDTAAMGDLAVAYEDAGRAKDAEAVLRRALSVDSEDGDVHVRLARVLLARGDREGARREAAAAAVLQPGKRAAIDLIPHAGGGQ